MMELVAKKTFMVGNRRRVTKGERFSVDGMLGRVYVAIGHAEHPPREMGKTEREVRALVATLEVVPSPPVYQTRVMTADVAAPAPRRRGRPRKKVASE